LGDNAEWGFPQGSGGLGECEIQKGGRIRLQAGGFFSMTGGTPILRVRRGALRAGDGRGESAWVLTEAQGGRSTTGGTNAKCGGAAGSEIISFAAWRLRGNSIGFFSQPEKESNFFKVYLS
jgi:hypothetical protein